MEVTRSLVHSLPKADLHSHIDGSLSPAELFRISRRIGRKIKTSSGKVFETPGQLSSHIRGAGYSTLLEEIVARFDPIVGLMQTEEALKEVGSAYVGYLDSHRVAYAEGRFAPQYHVRERMTLRDAIESMADGLAEGMESHEVRVGLIVAIGREADPRLGLKVAEAATSCGRAVALDLGGPEVSNPPGKFRSAFAHADRMGLRKTVHAGEGAGSVRQNLSNIRASIDLLGADRLGHAIDLWKDPALVTEVSEKGIGVETNPISNLVLKKIGSVRDLHLDLLLRRGVRVTVNTDDPALWPRGSIDDILLSVCQAYGFGTEGLDLLVNNSFASSFAPPEVRDALSQAYSRARGLR